MKPTAKEKFVSKLKDPIGANLDSAIEEFHLAHPSIYSIRVFPSKDKSYYHYAIEVYADNFGILLATKEIFKNTIIKHVGKNAVINERGHPDEGAHSKPSTLFRHSFFMVVE